MYFSVQISLTAIGSDPLLTGEAEQTTSKYPINIDYLG